MGDVVLLYSWMGRSGSTWILQAKVLGRLGSFPVLMHEKDHLVERRDTWRRLTCLSFEIWRRKVAVCLRPWVAGEQMLPQRERGGRVSVRLGGKEDPAGGPWEQAEGLGGFRFIQSESLPGVFPGSLLIFVFASF